MLRKGLGKNYSLAKIRDYCWWLKFGYITSWGNGSFSDSDYLQSFISQVVQDFWTINSSIQPSCWYFLAYFFSTLRQRLLGVDFGGIPLLNHHLGEFPRRVGRYILPRCICNNIYIYVSVYKSTHQKVAAFMKWVDLDGILKSFVDMSGIRRGIDVIMYIYTLEVKDH